MQDSRSSHLDLRNAFLYLAGIGFLTLAKARHVLRGYTSPKPFDLSQTERCVAYDLRVVDEWLQYLDRYTGAQAGGVRGKHILEIGPGSDLGVGLYLLAKGAAAYNACDAHDLARRAPREFYAALVQRIKALDPNVDAEQLRAEVEGALTGTSSRLRYVVRPDFDLTAAFSARSIDLVVSQASFEHLDDVAGTLRKLSALCRPGARLVAEIDLKTHSRWIRDKDPNNIYRYSTVLYGRFWFKGIPNRVRPYQYREALEAHGWADVSITPIECVAPWPDGSSVYSTFRDPRNQLEILSAVLCATKL
jgi:SAM-dependent methyltransferase